MATAPYTNYKLRYSKQTGEILYARPKDTPTYSAEDLDILHDDYFQLREYYRAFLAARYWGEIELFFNVGGYLEAKESLVLTQEEIRTIWNKRAVTENPDPIGVLLTPAALSQGLLTTDVSPVFNDAKKYVASLEICMRQCLHPNDVGSRWSSEGLPLDVSSRTMKAVWEEVPMAIGHPSNAQDDISYMRPIYEQVKAINGLTGRGTLNAIYGILALDTTSSDLQGHVESTVRSWAMQCMARPRAERVPWLVRKFRTAVMSHFLAGGGRQKTRYPDDTRAQEYMLVWNALAYPSSRYNVTTQNNIDVAKEDIADIVNGGDVTSYVPHVIYDGSVVCESLFYAPVIAPLVITVATITVYLSKFDEGRILPRTELLARQKFVPPSFVDNERHGDLVSYSTFVTHALNISLGGHLVSDAGVPFVTNWAPASMSLYTGKNLRETAQNLIAVWKKMSTATARHWEKALLATLLVVDGNVRV